MLSGNPIKKVLDLRIYTDINVDENPFFNFHFAMLLINNQPGKHYG